MSRKPRFYNTLRAIGPNGAARRNYYLQYLQGLVDEPEAKGTIDNRAARQKVYVKPFSIPLAADGKETESCITTAYTEMRGVAGLDAYVTDALGTDTSIEILSYKAPRVSRKILAGVKNGKSKFTGANYTVRGGSSLSLPFGRNLVGDTVLSVYGPAKAALELANPNARVTLIPEVY